MHDWIRQIDSNIFYLIQFVSNTAILDMMMRFLFIEILNRTKDSFPRFLVVLNRYVDLLSVFWQMLGNALQLHNVAEMRFEGLLQDYGEGNILFRDCTYTPETNVVKLDDDKK